MKKYSVTVTLTGAAESAEGEGRIELHGGKKIYAIIIDYTSQPTTTDVTITDGDEAVTSNILIQSNSGTDKVFYPRVVATKAADGTASTLTEVMPVCEALKIKAVQGSAGTVQVFVFFED